jgi:2,3-bisphosphoglycerate-dependent phosphoglycerate mutase
VQPSDAFALVRHGRSAYNAEHRLNGDPAVAVPLDEEGVAQVRALRPRVDALPLDLAVHTRFGRTLQTLDILLEGRAVPRRELALLDDVRLGEFEGAARDEYRQWRAARGPDARPEGGESRIDALRRYAAGFALLLEEAPGPTLVVTHDIPIRFLSNALRAADPLDGPVRDVANASLLVVERPAMRAAVTAMRAALTTAAS